MKRIKHIIHQEMNFLKENITHKSCPKDGGMAQSITGKQKSIEYEEIKIRPTLSCLIFDLHMVAIS